MNGLLWQAACPLSVVRTALSVLKELDLSGTKVTDGGLSNLAACRQLQWLSLSNTQITDSGLSNLAACRQLRALELVGTKITDAGLANLAPLNKLQVLDVGGLVKQPAKFSLADLRALPSRTQITRHDCVEGWSCIGKWTGCRLSAVLSAAGLKTNARYIVFHCADKLPGGAFSPPVPYYESIDLDDAFHEQTILAYEMNGQTLTIPHGAPLRLRVERQLGYKHAKYIMGIEAVESFAQIGDGNGSYWADHGYSWYAGI